MEAHSCLISSLGWLTIRRPWCRRLLEPMIRFLVWIHGLLSHLPRPVWKQNICISLRTKERSFHSSVACHAQLFWFCITMLSDWLKHFAPFCYSIRRTIVVRSHSFSRALRQLHVDASRFTCFNGLSESLKILPPDSIFKTSGTIVNFMGLRSR